MKIIENKGITLIALVVIIVVLLILTGVSIAMLTGENGILTTANKAKLSTEFAQYKEELELFKMNEMSKNSNFIEASLTAGANNIYYNTQKEGETGNIKNVITSLNEKYLNIFEIIKGELSANTQDNNIIKVCQSLEIAVNPYDIVDGELLSSNGNLLLMDETGTLIIPDTITSIGEGAFANLNGLKTIIIPGTVKEIKASAFAYNTTLENVILQEGVETIGKGAFFGCTSLKNINMPESLEQIVGEAFYNCMKLTSIEIPSKIATIEINTFSGCSNLETVTFRGNNIVKIESTAFGNCISLNNFTITENVTSINSSAFNNCKMLEKFNIEGDNFVYESGMLLTANRESILFISTKYYSTVTEFTIPEGVKNFTTSIANLTNIKKINIPASVTGISVNTFTPSVEEIVIDEKNNNYKIYENCIYTKDDKKLIYCYSKATEIVLTNNATTIGDFSFLGATNAEYITLSESITTIGQQVFNNCKKIKEIKLGENVQSINPLFKLYNYEGKVTIDEKNLNYMVENNIIYSKNKEKIIVVLYQIKGRFVLDNNVKEIGDHAFRFQSGMTEIQLTNNLEKIGDSFGFCTALTAIEIPSSVKSISINAFVYDQNLKEIRVNLPKNSIEGAPWGATLGDKAVIWKE